ncbi:hypothetical protein AKO1_007795 [Acrasis kona]|uniref:Uncharacterized protein n=1 Tax=Acrasis kona TaxID=1008807 RepID=A0AAW2YQ57_9EUKA
MLKSDNGDIRFLCLKIITDILVRYLNDPNMYDAREANHECTYAINNFIMKKLLPHYRFILEDQDPVPLYGLKLLNNIAQHNAGFIAVISKMDLTSLIFNFFELEHRNNNVHNVRLILKIVAADVMDPEQMYRMEIVKKLNDVLEYAFDNNVDTFYESCLNIADHLLYRSSKMIHKSKGSSNANDREQAEKTYKHNEAFTNNIAVYVALSSHQDPSIAESSAHVLLMMIQQYPSTHEYLFSTNGLSYLKKGLLENMKEDETNIELTNQNVIKYLLKCVHVVLNNNNKYVNRLLREDMIRLAIERLVEEKSKGDEISTTAEAIMKKLNG